MRRRQTKTRDIKIDIGFRTRPVTICSKIVYISKKKAKQALKGKGNDYGPNTLLRVYKCSTCKQWHTTTQEKHNKGETE